MAHNASPRRWRPGWRAGPGSGSTRRCGSPRRSRRTLLMADRYYDVVVLGPTGFPGAVPAEYHAASGGAGRWAIAGRTRSKLDAVRERLPGDVPAIVADIGDAASVRAMGEATRGVITTVG